MLKEILFQRELGSKWIMFMGSERRYNKLMWTMKFDNLFVFYDFGCLVL